MKRIFSVIAVWAVCASLTGCETDEIWDRFDELDSRITALEKYVHTANADIQTLQQIVDALQSKVTVDRVVTTSDGYRIEFSDGTTAQITNGRDGTNAPTISVRQHTDGYYYWTLDGEFMRVDGQMVRASAADGRPGDKGDKGDRGDDGVTPRIRINESTGEWEYSLDEGQTWTSTGVVASGSKGESGDPLFRSIDTESDEYVTFTLADGTEIRLQRTCELRFTIEGAPAGESVGFKFGTTKRFAVTSNGVAEHMISHPDGWRASYDGTQLSITAPAASNPYAARSGDVAVMVVAAGGQSKIVKLAVEAMAYELRVLTFEDSDYKGGNDASYWSSLIDPQEYNGDMLYGGDEYTWSDDGNTMLTSGLADFYGDYMFWYGGQVISNYVLTDLSLGNYDRQLSVYYRHANGNGGHNGSENFCVSFEFVGMGLYPALSFSDDKARVIDHMYITMTTYTANSLLIGDSFSGGAAGPDDWFSVTATGYNEQGQPTGTTSTFYLYRGTPVTEWTRWDMTELGPVARVEFRCDGSKSGAYGLNTPAYFAYDDVAVRFED